MIFSHIIKKPVTGDNLLNSLLRSFSNNRRTLLLCQSKEEKSEMFPFIFNHQKQMPSTVKFNQQGLLTNIPINFRKLLRYSYFPHKIHSLSNNHRT